MKLIEAGVLEGGLTTPDNIVEDNNTHTVDALDYRDENRLLNGECPYNSFSPFLTSYHTAHYNDQRAYYLCPNLQPYVNIHRAMENQEKMDICEHNTDVDFNDLMKMFKKCKNKRYKKEFYKECMIINVPII